MNLEYIFRKMCERRAVKLAKVQSVAFSVRVSFGLATGTFLIPAVVNSFCYILDGFVTPIGAAITGMPMLRLTNYGGGSVGDLDCSVWNLPHAHYSFPACEFDSMAYIVNTHSAGSFAILGTVFRITYTP